MARNPVAIRASKQVRIRDREELVIDLLGQIDEIRHARAVWETRIAEDRQSRFGDKGSTDAEWPWRGAANIVYPLIDTEIAKQVPLLSRLIFKPSPVARVSPVGHEDYDSAAKVEQWFEYYAKARLNRYGRLYDNITRNNDCMCEGGLSFLKVFWDYKTERATEVVSIEDLLGTHDQAQRIQLTNDQIVAQVISALDLEPEEYEEDRELLNAILDQVSANKESIIFEREYEVVNEARIDHVQPYDLLFPVDTAAIQEAGMVAHRIYLPRWELRARAQDGSYNSSAVNEVLKWQEPQGKGNKTLNRADSYIRQEAYARSGVSPSTRSRDKIELLECYFYHDAGGQGVYRKCVATIHEATQQVVRPVTEFPYRHSLWPFVEFMYERTDGLLLTVRGIARILLDVQKELTALHRGKLDHMSLTNNPPWLKRQGSGLPRELGLYPGRVYQCRDPERDLRQAIAIKNDFSYEREEMILLGIAESRVGNFAAQITDPQRRGERRTATEIAEIAEITGVVFDDLAERYQSSMREVWRQVFALSQQYAPNDDWYRTVGIDKSEVSTISREELAKEYDLIPAGTPLNTASRMKINELIQIGSMALGTPQTADSIDGPSYIKTLFDIIDPKISGRVMNVEGGNVIDQAQDEMLEIIAAVLAGVPPKAKPSENHAVRLNVLRKFLVQNSVLRDNAPEEALRILMLHEEETRVLAEKQTRQEIPNLQELVSQERGGGGGPQAAPE